MDDDPGKSPKGETQTKEALAQTIRELGRQNDELRRKYEAVLRRPKGSQIITACLGFGIFLDLPRPRSTLILNAQPQVVFQPERLCVSRECAGHFVIGDLKVGMKSQFVAPGSLPARLFAVENVHRLREIETEEDFDTAIPVTFDVALPGMFVTLSITRIDDSTIPFECVIVGSTVEIEKDQLHEGPITLPKRGSIPESPRRGDIPVLPPVGGTMLPLDDSGKSPKGDKKKN